MIATLSKIIIFVKFMKCNRNQLDINKQAKDINKFQHLKNIDCTITQITFSNSLLYRIKKKYYENHHALFHIQYV